jgi:hypothetical protein
VINDAKGDVLQINTNIPWKNPTEVFLGRPVSIVLPLMEMEFR